MANNCDYCHKPLSLMRRLRGEQFCSVEHLDAYTAQQAEFALERLAASVSDKPNTARPPLPKPATRVRPIAAPSAVPPVEAQQELPVMAGAVAVQEREGEAVAPASRVIEPDYPMAPYLEQSEIEPREFETTEDRKIGFEPVEHWGKVAQGWSMPPFRSEPSDPRTWNAGKLVAQIPPVAGWRELLAPRALVQEERAAETWAQGMLMAADGTALAPAAAQPVWSGMTDVVYGCFALAENRLAAARAMAGGLQARATSMEWYQVSDAQFAPIAVVHGQVSVSTGGMPQLPVAEAQRVERKARSADAEQAVGADGQITPAARELALPGPREWNWAQTLEAPKVGMPEFAAARPDAAGAVANVDWLEAEGAVRGPEARWPGANLRNGGVQFGWESAQAKRIEWGTVSSEGAAFRTQAPVMLDVQGQAIAKLPWASPVLWRNWSGQTIRLTSFEVGPVLTTAGDVQWLPVVPFRVEGLRPRQRLAPPVTAVLRTTVRLMAPPEDAPAVWTEIRQAGPTKYSPVAIVVMPPPQFALAPAAVADEQRYVAQVPNGVWRLPRVRHTGYRALGPFPKLPLRVPDGYLSTVAPEMAPVATEMRLREVEVRQDLGGIPRFASPDSLRKHPAEYLAWPQPKGLKLGRMLPERASQADAAAAPIKRFGPGRAGLQSRRRNADGLARA